MTVGVLAATGTPSYAVTRINAEVTRALKTPEVIKQLNTLGIEPVGGPADRYAAAIAEEGKRYEDAIKAAGIKAE
ncbi:Tripartite tricarboxylate transporter family receptor [Mycobacteroides abscessus subsp. abscessus]|nr:Tripartite tricarboxylate transporter family receptor [Mycobacteroides abscessus subsp. abscessus]